MTLSVNDDGSLPMIRDEVGRPMLAPGIEDLLVSGGGFPVPVYVATVALDDDDIKALSGTPVQIVSAPGANKVIVPLFGVCRSAVAVAYDSSAAAAALRLVYVGGGLASSLLVLNLAVASNFIGSFVSYSQADAAYDPEVTTLAVSTSDWVNKALAVKEDWVGGGVFTEGDAANAITVTVTYVILDV